MVKVIKKVFAILLALVLMVFLLAGCDTKDSTKVEVGGATGKSTLVFLEKIQIDDLGSISLWAYICYDRETKVMYMVSYVYGSGVAITVMVDEEGNPRLYKG